MKPLLLGIVLALVASCQPAPPHPPVPPTPSVFLYSVVVTPASGVTATLVPDLGHPAVPGQPDGHGAFFFSSDAQGIGAFLDLAAEGYRAQHTRVDVLPLGGGALQPVTLPRAYPTRAQVLALAADFGGWPGPDGRRSWDVVYPCLDTNGRADFRAAKHAANLTHIVLASYGSDYPGLDPHCALDPSTLRARVGELLDDSLIPILFVSNGADYQTTFADRLPALAAALNDVQAFVWWVPGFEVVGPGATWTSKQLSLALLALHALGDVVIGVHLQPERASGASYPVEADDPWQGCEPCFWTAHGGEWANGGLLYEAPHGDKLLNPVNAWLDRWQEIIERLAVTGGGHGWVQVPVSFFEVTLYDEINGRSTEADKRRINQTAQAACRAIDATCSFGNGQP